MRRTTLALVFALVPAAGLAAGHPPSEGELGMAVIGDRELPRLLYLLPWRDPAAPPTPPLPALPSALAPPSPVPEDEEGPAPIIDAGRRTE